MFLRVDVAQIPDPQVSFSSGQVHIYINTNHEMILAWVKQTIPSNLAILLQHEKSLWIVCSRY